MAAIDYSIGNFQFLEIRPNRWGLIHEQLTLSQRPAFDGVQLTKIGRRARPFIVTTSVDSANQGTAQQQLAAYADLAGKDPVEMELAGVSSNAIGPQGFKVAVLAVEPANVMAIRASVGLQYNPPSRAIVEARWTLIAIENQAAPPPS